MATYSASQTTGGLPYKFPRLVARNWGLIMLRGIAAILFGLFALAKPGITLVTLILLFGTYAIADGLIAIAAAILQEGIQHRWWLGLVGFVSVAVGIATFRSPGLTGVLLLYYIATWALIGGALQVVGAIAVRKVITGEWALILGGVLSVMVGIALFARPGAGALTFITLIGIYAIISGVLFTLFSLRLRRFGHQGADAPRAPRVG